LVIDMVEMLLMLLISSKVLYGMLYDWMMSVLMLLMLLISLLSVSVLMFLLEVSKIFYCVFQNCGWGGVWSEGEEWNISSVICRSV
jgi:hypothetical protein